MFHIESNLSALQEVTSCKSNIACVGNAVTVLSEVTSTHCLSVILQAPIWVHGPVRGLYWVVGTYVGLLQAGAQACGELALSVTEHALLSALPPGKVCVDCQYKIC